MLEHIKFFRFLKKIIPFWLRLILIKLIVVFQAAFYQVFPKKLQLDTNKNIFVFFSTDYPNLGDHALSYAHIILLKKFFPDALIHEISVGETYKYLKFIKKNIGPNDLITMKGGGNIGLQYFREELMRRSIIKTFMHNRIVMFPQTVFFPPTKKGDKEFKKTIKIMKANNNFYAFLRDGQSFELLNRHVKNAFLVPDIVFSLSELDFSELRHGIVTCLRNDPEGILKEDFKKELFNYITDTYGKDLLITDTIRDYKIDSSNRLPELLQMWKIIGNAKILITDRLHGMIFAALLSTPCIVLNNYNHKIQGQYEWIKDCNYIRLCDSNLDSISETIKVLIDIDVQPISWKEFEKKYSSLFAVLKQEY